MSLHLPVPLSNWKLELVFSITLAVLGMKKGRRKRQSEATTSSRIAVKRLPSGDGQKPTTAKKPAAATKRLLKRPASVALAPQMLEMAIHEEGPEMVSPQGLWEASKIPLKLRGCVVDNRDALLCAKQVPLIDMRRGLCKSLGISEQELEKGPSRLVFRETGGVLQAVLLPRLGGHDYPFELDEEEAYEAKWGLNYKGWSTDWVTIGGILRGGDPRASKYRYRVNRLTQLARYCMGTSIELKIGTSGDDLGKLYGEMR